MALDSLLIAFLGHLQVGTFPKIILKYKIPSLYMVFINCSNWVKKNFYINEDAIWMAKCLLGVEEAPRLDP